MPSPRNWQAINGDFEITSGCVKFLGAAVSLSQTSEQVPALGVVMSDLTFSGGAITMTVGYQDAPAIPSAQIVIYRNPENNSFLSAGIDGGFVTEATKAQFLISTYDGTQGGRGFSRLASTPLVERQATDNLRLRVTQRGSLMSLYANDVQVLRHTLNSPVAASQCGIYCHAACAVEFSDYVVDTSSRSAFVIMEFSPPFEDLFAEVIRPVAQNCGLEAKKADDVLGPGVIIWDVIREIEEADVVIADITPINANVYYEIGYAHAMGKPTILLAERGKELPFDISGFRVLFYENSIAGKSQIENALRRHIGAVVKEM